MRKILILLYIFSGAAFAGEAQDMAKDPVIEKRMVILAEELRCLVCQNESLASSHAELADDLRREVRELMQKGMTDQEIKDYLVARYGDFVLYEPPMKNSTLLLWFGPFALLIAGLGVLVFQMRNRKKSVTEDVLSPEAEARAAALLNDEKR
jgi:cytochrome c-type biogenesis protein CcmH